MHTYQVSTPSNNIATGSNIIIGTASNAGKVLHR